MAELPSETLERALTLKQATALNMIDMVGIGPFVVIPLVIANMHGPQCLIAWAAGALLALLDGCVWAELGAAMPLAGGSYNFLREAYGPLRWGRLMSFLFIWQTMFQAPLVIASGSIGFSQYLTYLVPLGPYQQKAVSGALVLLIVVLLYRRIAEIGRISLFLWVGVIATMLWLIVGGLTHFRPELAFTYPPGAWNFSWLFFLGLGAATQQTMYSYLGYYNVCHLGGEIRAPEKNIPRSIFISILGIAVLYLVMQTAAASLFSATLGYSRIPYAAAVDGTFFKVFARLHPTKRFPHVSLLALGAVAFVFSLLFKLRDVISAMLAMRILVQFVGGAVGLIILHRRWPAERLPFRMWLYPFPVLAVIVLWLAVFASTGRHALAGIGVLLLGAVAFLVRARIENQWPFSQAVS